MSELVVTSASAGRPAAGPSPGKDLFIVGGRYCPLFAKGLPPPPGAPILRVWSKCGFTTLPLPAWNPGGGLGPGPGAALGPLCEA